LVSVHESYFFCLARESGKGLCTLLDFFS
jgi:hypothetical protein